MFRLNLWFVIVSTLFSLIGCRPLQNGGSASALLWGHERKSMDSRLINAEPNTVILLCGSEQQALTQTQDMILRWAKTIERHEALRFEYARDLNDCRDRRFAIQVLSVAESHATNSCDGSPGVVHFDKDQIRYAICVRAGGVFDGHRMSQADIDRIKLHEVGHLWGLCDQYAGSNNCDPRHSANKGRLDESARNSIMGGRLSIQYITEDDWLGMQNLSERDDISANSIWREFLK